MAGTYTTLGISYLAQCEANNTPIKIEKYVIAFVENLDENSVLELDFSLTNLLNIVDEVEADKPFFNNQDAVTYSLVLGSEVGDYDFNLVGLVSDSGVLVAYSVVPLVKKRKASAAAWNENFVFRRANAKDLFQADLPVESWQVDYTAQFNNMNAAVYQNAINQITTQTQVIKQAHFQLGLDERLRKLEG